MNTREVHISPQNKSLKNKVPTSSNYFDWKRTLLTQYRMGICFLPSGIILFIFNKKTRMISFKNLTSFININAKKNNRNARNQDKPK